MGQRPGMAEDRQKEPDTGKSSGWLLKRESCLSEKHRRPSFSRLGERQWLKGDSTRIVTIRVDYWWKPARQRFFEQKGKIQEKMLRKKQRKIKRFQ
ncbi:hypothetical protein M5595_18130 [Eubacterium limosum]|uniref:Uncharacterized protein n=1 Tax=Eubacterium limosum TaxID=1736 RepID=A0AAC9QV97_EUBLI|nr:hypothetical protein [Eubacterium limosum]ARD66226.1 hypothetical protein B2M23_11990 [Eubacterium limosum]UQZ22130.1 hypothetical protein M5595_18130 [Eubacterium limosum]